MTKPAGTPSASLTDESRRAADALAQAVVERYTREYDRFAKLTSVVEHVCRADVVEANAIRAAVTARTKHPSRLEGKVLRRLSTREWPSTLSVDQAFGRLGDLAAVRISTYVEADRARVVDQIKSVFLGPDGGPVAVDEKSHFDVHAGRFYRATHCDVVLPDEHVSGTNANLRNVRCEIQVSSMLAHVWNEIEHDLVYKPMTGDVSTEEREALRALGHLTVAADLVVQELYRATARRLEHQHGDFTDVYDFVARTRQHFPEATRFGDHAGQLLEVLVAEGYAAPDRLHELLGSDPAARSQALVEAYTARAADDDRAPALDPDTSDRLLVLVLERFAREVVDRYPSGRGLGRPPRIASIARRFLELDPPTEPPN